MYIVFDQLPAGDIQVCLGSDGTSDYLLVNITSQVQLLFDYAVHNLFSNFANKVFVGSFKQRNLCTLKFLSNKLS